MKTHIKILALCAAVLAAVTVAEAYNRHGQESPNRKQAGFNCPVCDSPCINKSDLQRKMRQQRKHDQYAPQVRRNNRPGPNNQQWQGERKSTAHRPEQRARRQEPGRFDIDGDGQLSHAEKAARRAYRDARYQERDGQPQERPHPQPPVE